MPAYDGAGMIHALRARITRLGANGAPLTGPKSVIVTKALVRGSFTAEKSTGTELEQKNGSDEVCLYYKAPDTVKGITFTLELCTPDPEVEEMLAGGTVLVDGTDNVIGYAAPEVGTDPNPNGVSVELWGHAVINGAVATSLPYVHWVFPRLQLAPAQKAIENAITVPAFSGPGRENDGWGTGPAADWTHESSRLWQWAREATIPAETAGAVAFPIV